MIIKGLGLALTTEDMKRVTHAVGAMSQRRISELKFAMNRYSPYDYVDSYTFKTEDEYKRHLKIIAENGGTITYE